MRRDLAVIVLACGLASCTLLLNDKLDALQGGASDAASSPASDAAVVVGSDAGNSGDGGSGIEDGGGGDAGPAPPFCSTQGTFLYCDDFDNARRSFEVEWPTAQLEKNATMVKSSERSRSPSTSVLVTTSPTAGEGAGAGRLLEYDWDGTRKTLFFGMSIFIEAFPTQPSGEAFLAPLIPWSTTADFTSTRIKLVPNGAGIDFFTESVLYEVEGDPGKFAQVPITVPLKQWTRIERTMQLAVDKPIETLMIDGVKATDFELPLAFKSGATGVTLTLGFQYTTGPDGYRVYIDDVVFRAE